MLDAAYAGLRLPNEPTSAKENIVKNLAIAVIGAALAFAAPVFADDAHHPEKATDQPAAAAPTKVPAATAAETTRKMQANVRKMEAQLARLAKAKTEDGRQQVLAEHMKTMHENAELAHSMGAAMPMDCPMMKGGMQGGMKGMDMMKPGSQ